MPNLADIALANATLKGSPLAGQGAAFVISGERHDVDWRLLVAIARSETELGRTGGATTIHNPFGLGPGMSFAGWPQAIDKAASVIARYRKEGRTTVAEIGAKWAPVGAANDPRNLNSNWVRNVSRFFRDLGGDPGKDPTAFKGGGIGSIPGDAADVVTGAAGAVTDAILGPVGAVIGFVKDYAPKLLAFALLGVIGVWLVSQGASKAFGTPTIGQVAQAAPKVVPIPV